MNLVEGLLKADEKKAKEYATGTFKSERLARILGQDEPVEIEIKEIDMRTIKNIQQYSMKKDGTVDRNKMYDSNLMCVVEGVTNPDLKNEELQKHFGAGSARELAEILFRFEAAFIADAIANMSQMQHKNDEEIIKN